MPYIPDMTVIDQNEDTIGQLVMEINERKTKVENIVDEMIDGTAIMKEDLFWELTEQLIKNWKSAKSRLGIHRFIWNFVFGQIDDPYLAMQYIRTYRHKVDRLYKPLFDVIKGFGDDGYGDVLDSFLLHGRERYEKALNGELEGDSKAQYQGENYIRTTLLKEFNKLYSIYCRYQARDKAEDV